MSRDRDESDPDASIWSRDSLSDQGSHVELIEPSGFNKVGFDTVYARREHVPIGENLIDEDLYRASDGEKTAKL